MLFVRSWLREYIDLSAYTNTQLESIITQKIAEVDEIEVKSDWFNNRVVVGQITKLAKHPEADKLNIFEVDFGGTLPNVTIVSAAANCRDGLVIPVALNGCLFPFMTIAPRKLRGIESNGMGCGMSELMLETEFSSGLWELNDILQSKNLSIESVLGQSICQILPEYFEPQTIIDIKVLPDKYGQIANHLGMALELSIALEDYNLLTERAKNLLNIDYVSAEYAKLIEAMPKSTTRIEITDQSNYVNSFDLYQLTPKTPDQGYNLPHIYQQRMFLSGRNLIGNMGDLSNYLLVDIGQPSHMFDQQKLVETTN